MLRWIDSENDWSAFRPALPIVAAVMTLAGLLVLVWRFEPASSPTWQLVLYHLMLVLFLSTTFVLAAQRRFCLGERFRRAMLVLAIVLPAVVFSASWFMNGAYEGARDERFLVLVVVSATSFMLLWEAAAVLRVAFVFGRELAREQPLIAPKR